jgi:hypothetical protein
MLPSILNTDSTSDAIARGNRLHILKQSPGFADLYRISEMLVKHATDALVNYPGWDQQQISVLKSRAQALSEHHVQLFSMVNEALAEARQESESILEQEASKRSTREAVLEADELRGDSMLALEGFEKSITDSRPAGSF